MAHLELAAPTPRRSPGRAGSGPCRACRLPAIVPALAVRADAQRPGHPRGDIVAVEQQRLAGVEGEVERGCARRRRSTRARCRRSTPPPVVRPAIRVKISCGPEKRACGCSWSMTMPVTALSSRAVLRSQRAADRRVDQPAADVGADRDGPGQVEHLGPRQPPQSVGRAGVAKLREQRRVHQLGDQRPAAERREARLRPADRLAVADRDRAQRRTGRRRPPPRGRRRSASRRAPARRG